MIEMAIIIIGLVLMTGIGCTTAYFFHTRTQVEMTKRMELQEKTVRQNNDNRWLAEQNRSDALQLAKGQITEDRIKGGW